MNLFISKQSLKSVINNYFSIPRKFLTQAFVNRAEMNCWKRNHYHPQRLTDEWPPCRLEEGNRKRWETSPSLPTRTQELALLLLSAISSRLCSPPSVSSLLSGMAKNTRNEKRMKNKSFEGEEKMFFPKITIEREIRFRCFLFVTRATIEYL